MIRLFCPACDSEQAGGWRSWLGGSRVSADALLAGAAASDTAMARRRRPTKFLGASTHFGAVPGQKGFVGAAHWVPTSFTPMPRFPTTLLALALPLTIAIAQTVAPPAATTSRDANQ